MDRHLHHIHAILQAIDSDAAVSQRTLASRLGIALGLTNLLIRRVVREKWVSAVREPANRVRYVLTPAGAAAKQRLTRDSFERTLRLYGAARAQLRQRLAVLSAELGHTAQTKRVVFFGGGAVAEIAYLSLQETDLQLVALVDSAPRQPFFGYPVHGLEALQPDRVSGQPFDRLVITAGEHTAVAARLKATGISPARTFWIWMPGALEKDDTEMMTPERLPC